MKPDVKTIISRRMKTRMFELDMTIKALGEKSEVPKRSIEDYVAMRNMMGAGTLAKIAEALEVSADWLLGRKEERQ